MSTYTFAKTLNKIWFRNKNNDKNMQHKDDLPDKIWQTWKRIQPAILKYRRIKKLYETEIWPFKIINERRIPSVIEIKPLDIKSTSDISDHVKDSGFYQPKLSDECYTHFSKQFKNRQKTHKTPQK